VLSPKRWLLAATTLLLANAALAQHEEVKDRATKDDYSVHTSGTTSEIEVGKPGTFSLVIHPKNGTKIHPQAPLEVKVNVPSGMRVDKGKLGRGDMHDKEAASPDLRTALHGEKDGQYSIEADVSFFLCTDEWCQRMTDRVSIPVRVRD
jgi:hypothetical protein